MRSRAPLFLLFTTVLSAGFRVEPLCAAEPNPSASLESIFEAERLELPALEGAVLQRNPSLASMRAAWEAMEARAVVAGGWDDPRVEAMVAPRSLGSSTVDPGWSIEISQMVPLFGPRSSMAQANRAMARAMREDYRAMRLETLRVTRELYFQLYLAARSIEVNREVAGLLDQLRRVALQKYAAGTVGQQDALQAEVELGMLEHQLVAASRTRREVQARLRALLHDESDRAVPDPPRELPHIAHEMADTSFTVAAGHRPELASREATLEARRAEVTAAGRMRRPDLMLIARHDRAMDMPEWRTMVGAGITVPLWLGKNGASVRAARADLRRAEQERSAVADSIRAQVEIARARVQETTHELDIIETRVLPATERALASVRAGYESNRSDFLALLTAERDLFRTRLERYQAIAMTHMALADLERAMGREPEALREEAPR